MKRSNDDVVGLPHARMYSHAQVHTQDVAGAPIVPRATDVASFRHALDDPMGTAESDAELLAEFAEFMDGDQAFARRELPEPDPGFQERLRRRLWRAHVLAYLRDAGEPH